MIARITSLLRDAGALLDSLQSIAVSKAFREPGASSYRTHHIVLDCNPVLVCGRPGLSGFSVVTL